MFQLTLKNLREKNGLSQADLARTLGVSRSTIGMWECGTNRPSSAMLLMLANLFHVKIDYLLNEPPTLPVAEPVAADTLSSFAVPYGRAPSTAYTAHGSLVYFSITDDSMEPIFSPCDRLVVRRQRSVASGDFVLLRLNEKELVRQIIFDAHGVILQAGNRSHFPSYHRLNTGGEIPFLIGKVIQLQRNFD